MLSGRCRCKVIVTGRWHGGSFVGAVALSRRWARRTLLRCCSDGSGELVERCDEPGGHRGAEFDVIVTAAQVLDEGMSGDDLGGPIGLESAHRSQSALELAVIGLDPIVLV